MKKLSLFVIIMLCGVLTMAQKPMSIVDFLSIPGVGSPRLSPDGKEVLYVFSQSDWEANKQIGHIWLVNADGTNGRQITAGKNGESNPRWSPDGRHISFTARRDDDEATQVYLMA